MSLWPAASPQAPPRVDPYTGIWILNVAKSTGDSVSQTLTIDVRGDTETYRSELVSANGRRQVTTYSAAYDGKEYPSLTVVTEPGAAGSAVTRRDDTVRLAKVDDRTRERHWTQGGRVVRILRRVVSADGRTLTSQVVDVDDKGMEHTTSTLVFDKRSGASR
ncbi:MAG: hypothetical protein U0Q12_19415 [Vicinamibacterales bacterium]